jgi:hypothetical protein
MKKGKEKSEKYRRGRPKKRWMTFVKNDMRIKGVSMEMTSDMSIREWKKKTLCA